MVRTGLVQPAAPQELPEHKCPDRAHPGRGVGRRDARTPPGSHTGWCDSTSCPLSRLAECLSPLPGHFLQERHHRKYPAQLPKVLVCSVCVFNCIPSLPRTQKVRKIILGLMRVAGAVTTKPVSLLLRCFAMRPHLSWDDPSQMAAWDFRKTDSWEVYQTRSSKPQEWAPLPQRHLSFLLLFFWSPHFKPHRIFNIIP